MDNVTNSFTKYFLPSYFKIIGLVLVVISIIVLIFAAIVRTYLDFFPAAHRVLMFNKVSLVCGLSFIIFSKGKRENEEIDKSRFNALVFSVAASVLIIVLLEVINIFNYQVQLFATDFLIIEMCLYYIFFSVQDYF
jgi:hypothetical protein